MKTRKRIVSVVLCLVMMFGMLVSITPSANAARLYNAWSYSAGYWHYYDANGHTVQGWRFIDGTWYYFNGNGNMVIGWQLIGGTWYYFNGGGAMVTGWLLLGNTWYFMNGGGAMVTGWQYIGGSWYYFDASGAMATGWRMVGSTWYYMNGGGAMVTGWLLLGNTWYYMNGSGAMVTGWQLIDGTWHYFDSSGAWNSNGASSAKDTALADAKTKADYGQYLEAIRVLEQYMAVNGADSAVQNQLTQYQNLYANQQVSAASAVFITPVNDYDDALTIINAALQNVPGNAILTAQKQYYQSFAPVYLSDEIPYQKSTWFSSKDSDMDVFGVTRYHCVRIAKNFTSASGTYDLSGKYNEFKATIYGLGDGEYGWIKIYGDGVCLYSNTNIDVYTRAFNISLDVTGVTDLKIEMKQNYNSYVGECFGLSEVTVQRTEK